MAVQQQQQYGDRVEEYSPQILPPDQQMHPHGDQMMLSREQMGPSRGQPGIPREQMGIPREQMGVPMREQQLMPLGVDPSLLESLSVRPCHAPMSSDDTSQTAALLSYRVCDRCGSQMQACSSRDVCACLQP